MHTGNPWLRGGPAVLQGAGCTPALASHCSQAGLPRTWRTRLLPLGECSGGGQRSWPPEVMHAGSALQWRRPGVLRALPASAVRPLLLVPFLLPCIPLPKKTSLPLCVYSGVPSLSSVILGNSGLRCSAPGKPPSSCCSDPVQFSLEASEVWRESDRLCWSHFWFCFVSFSGASIKLGALCMLGKCSITELQLQPCF